MNTARYRVVHCSRVRDELFSLVGVVEGEVPDVGSVGTTLSADAGVSVEVAGIGVVDPNLVEPDRRGLLVRVIDGEGEDINGKTFEFEWESKVSET